MKRNEFLKGTFALAGASLIAPSVVAKQTSTGQAPNFEIPQSLTFKKVGKKGGKIMANFTTSNLPDYIRIKFTADLTRVRPKKMIWVSENKYMSLGVTLQFFKNEDIAATQVYDTSGNIVLPVVNTANIQIPTLSASGSTVSLVWNSINEVNLTQYEISRQDSPDADYVLQQTLPALGNNQAYSFSQNVNSGNYFYQIVARFTDGTDALIFLDTVTV